MPIKGDLTSKEDVGIAIEDLDTLRLEVNVVIHCAVLIDHTFSFQNHIDVNVLGTLRLFEVSKLFLCLENFLHISVGYVSPPDGHIKEKRLKLDFNPETLLEQITASGNFHPSQSINEFGSSKRVKQHLFSKALAEILLSKRNSNGDTLTILRPVMYGACWKSPVPGFIDELNVTGAFIISVGSGVLKVVEGLMDNQTDVIPVDVMADYCISSAAFYSNNHRTNYM